jgi:hypothetical protein
MMEATARQDSPQPGPAPRWPSLEVVPDPAEDPTVPVRSDAEEAAAREGAVFRAAAIGFFVGYAAVAVILMIAGTAGGLELSSSLGLAVFVGAFSGGGFGFMGAAVLALARQEWAASADSTDQSPTADHTETET